MYHLLVLKTPYCVFVAQRVSSLSDAHAVSVGLKTISHNAYAKVLAVTVAQKTLVAGSKDVARVHITDVFDAAVGSLKVQLVHAYLAVLSSEEAVVSNQPFEKESKTEYVLMFYCFFFVCFFFFPVL